MNAELPRERLGPTGLRQAHTARQTQPGSITATSEHPEGNEPGMLGPSGTEVMSHYLLRLGSIALLCMAGCGGGGGGGGGGTPVTPPSNLEYPRPVGILTVDVPAAPNTPTYDGRNTIG